MYTLPDLPYAYNALEPIISASLMHLHHEKHHQTYVNKLNAVLDEVPVLKELSLVELLTNLGSVPEPQRATIRNHGGGHYNHSLFWQCMTPDQSDGPDSPLHNAIVSRWGSMDAFTDEFNAKAVGLFGSGWVWVTKSLEIVALPNQDNPLSLGQGEPLMGLDVWEHAYYLDYQNKRDEYITQWWKVVDWRFVDKRFARLREA